jgi:adenylate kinase
MTNKKLVKQSLINTKKFKFCEKNNNELFILMIGAPGVGKGTYSKLLSKDLNLPVLSSGDELRNFVKVSKDPYVDDIKKIMEEGKLVNDDFMLNFMLERINKLKDGVILDGFPRRITQAEMFDKYKTINLVVKLNLNEELLIKKLVGRRVCVNCGRNYNICTIKENGYDMEALIPKKDPTGRKCDDCNSELIQRNDDTESIFRERLNIYKELTIPLENFYIKKGILTEIELKRGIKDYPILRDLVIQQLKLKYYK